MPSKLSRPGASRGVRPWTSRDRRASVFRAGPDVMRDRLQRLERRDVGGAGQRDVEDADAVHLRPPSGLLFRQSCARADRQRGVAERQQLDQAADEEAGAKGGAAPDRPDTRIRAAARTSAPRATSSRIRVRVPCLGIGEVAVLRQRRLGRGEEAPLVGRQRQAFEARRSRARRASAGPVREG